MKNKYIIIDPEAGVFLGTTGRKEISGFRKVPADAEIIALFSADNFFELTKAAAFFTHEDATTYMGTYINVRSPDAFVAEIKDESDGPYVDVVSIIKSGYGDYTFDMIDGLPVPNRYLH